MIQTQKLTLNKKPFKNTVFSFDSQEIEVIPYISVGGQSLLIDAYIKAYFDGNIEDRLGAELKSKKLILEMMTNIEILNGENIVEDIENVESSGLWEKIEKSIRNYRTYLYNLSVALEGEKKNRSDIGYIFNKFLEEKVSPVIEKLSNFEMSDEKLAEVKSIMAELGSQIKGTPLESIIKNGTV